MNSKTSRAKCSFRSWSDTIFRRASSPSTTRRIACARSATPSRTADDRPSLEAAVREAGGFPCVFKTRTLGYDGHGQVVLRSEEDMAKVEPYFGRPGIVEEFVAFDFEASAIVVGDGRETVCFPVGRNVHRDGILDLSVVPAEIPDALRDRIVSESRRFMQECGYRGILAIEYFVKGDEIYFNEMAPRPHNSGHWTIEGCTTNQFRELARYLLGMPLEEPRLVAPTVMKNILGRDLAAAEAIAREGRADVHVHLYGKRESRPLRKMGHITFVGLSGGQFAAEWAARFE